uniref:(California timema) hypothetical protein n=1 Tax=Timema californicum TaxID=61474 RepID=A0A7R9JE31_TIMCA|nr:unnamed protein product [Timema californicum]
MVKVIQGQVAVKGHCPEVTVVDNFDVSRYSGVWYEQKRLFFLIEGNGICVNATYTPQEDGTVQVLNQNYSPEQSGKTLREGMETLSLHPTGIRTPISSSSAAHSIARVTPLTMRPPKRVQVCVLFDAAPISAPYWVLGTDYTSYSVQNMMQESEVLSMLEARMGKLETCIVGSPPNLDSQTSGNTVCDSLLHTNTLVATALSGREKLSMTTIPGRILDSSVVDHWERLDKGPVLNSLVRVTAVLKRLDELERYVDPMFEENCSVDTSSKIEMILSAEPQIERNLELAQQFSNLVPLLDSKQVRDVTESSGRLEKLTVVLLDSKTRADGVSERVMGLIEQYNAIIQNLTLTFEHWDNVLTRAELSGQSKKEID